MEQGYRNSKCFFFSTVVSLFTPNIYIVVLFEKKKSNALHKIGPCLQYASKTNREHGLVSTSRAPVPRRACHAAGRVTTDLAASLWQADLRYRGPHKSSSLRRSGIWCIRWCYFSWHYTGNCENFFALRSVPHVRRCLVAVVRFLSQCTHPWAPKTFRSEKMASS